MPRIGDSPQSRLDIVPPLFVLEAATNQLGDKGTALSGPDPSVEVSDQFILQSYVQSHGPSIAHSRSGVRQALLHS